MAATRKCDADRLITNCGHCHGNDGADTSYTGIKSLARSSRRLTGEQILEGGQQFGAVDMSSWSASAKEALLLSRRHLSGQGDECDNSCRVTTFFGSPTQAADIPHVANIADILDLGAMRTPAVVIEGDVVISGRVLTVLGLKTSLESRRVIEPRPDRQFLWGLTASGSHDIVNRRMAMINNTNPDPICCPPAEPQPQTNLQGLEGPEADDELAKLAKAIGHPARVRILRMLSRKEARVCSQIVDELPLAQSTVSEHLRILKDAGLIRSNQDGPRIGYCINYDTLRKLKALVAII